MAEAYYIRVPLDDLEQPHWRCLLAETGGAEAIVLALRLRGLAAKCQSGGLITNHTGRPMQPDQIATHLGYTPQQLRRSLELLHLQDMVQAVDDDQGGIRVIDPVLDAHFGRTAPQLALTAKPTYSPNQRYSRPLAADERQRLRRTGQLPDGVQKLNKSRLMSRPNVTSNVTTPTQISNIVDEFRCHVTDSISNSINQSNSRGVTPAVAVPSAVPHPYTLPAEIHTAIAALPLAHQADALQVSTEEPGDPATKLAALQLFASALAGGKAKSAGYLRQAIRGGWGLKEAQELTADEAEAWAWWQGMNKEEQERIQLEHHSHLLGAPRLTPERKALILFRLNCRQQEAA